MWILLPPSFLLQHRWLTVLSKARFQSKCPLQVGGSASQLLSFPGIDLTVLHAPPQPPDRHIFKFKAMAACLVSEMVTKATSSGTSLSPKCESVSLELQQEPDTDGATSEPSSRLESSASLCPAKRPPPPDINAMSISLQTRMVEGDS